MNVMRILFIPIVCMVVNRPLLAAPSASSKAGGLDKPAMLAFARQLAAGRTIEANITEQGDDGYEFNVLTNGVIHVTAGNARGVLYAVYDVLGGKTSGKESPAFSVRGLNPCESLARHSPEMLTRLIDRMGRWKMNRLIIHSEYGFKANKDLILRECDQRGIDLVYYLYDNLCFGDVVPRSGWAVDEQGKLRPLFDHLECYDRLCASKAENFPPYRQGVIHYLHEHPDFRRVMFATADGNNYCQCPACLEKSPWDQCLPFFDIFFDQAAGHSRELLVYDERYKLPPDLSRIRKLDGIMFDLHSRSREVSLADPKSESGPMPSRYFSIDPRSRETTRNRYFYKRLREWRDAFPGTIYAFENLMIQGAWGVPTYNVPAYLEDLRQLHKDHINGMVYEAFEPGIRGNLPALNVLAQALWHPDQQFEIKEDHDPDLEHFHRLVRDFRASSNLTNLKALNNWLVNHPNRDEFDWSYIGFNSIRAVLSKDQRLNARLLDAATDQEKVFLQTNKLWDFMEKVDNPRETTARIIRQMLEQL